MKLGVPFGKGQRQWRTWSVAFAVVLIGFGVWVSAVVRPALAQRISQPAPVGSVHALARLEPEGGLIVVGVRPGTRVETLAVKEGDVVAAGTLLAVTEGHDAARAQLALAEAQWKNARHQRALEREKVAVEREQYDQTRESNLAAVRKLVSLARQRLDETALLARTLKADQLKEKAELEQSRFQGETERIHAEQRQKELEVADGLTSRLRAIEDKHLAEGGPDDEALHRQVEAARAALEQTVVKAPSAGRILALAAHPGEVSSGPLLYLGDVSAMVAIAEVDQSDATLVQVGDPARVTLQRLVVTGKVTRVADLVLPNQMHDVDPRALQDLRVIHVTIKLDDSTEASRFVNMQVEAAIQSRTTKAAGEATPR